MKKIMLLLFMAMPLMSFAQKNYVHIHASSGNTMSDIQYRLWGDVPSGIKTYYTYWEDDMEMGKLMALLGKEGFAFEGISTTGTAKFPSEVVIMSRDASSASKIQNVKIEDEGEPYEVARYNLQGMPVKPTEKGIQIIVFSNYTTKTVIVE